jgi:hypothetical protein
MSTLLSERGTRVCRGCNAESLTSILDLGRQPLPAEYGTTSDQVLERFPLHLRICRNCGLGQLGEFVLPERIFHDTYPYLSSASSTWVNHASAYALAMTEALSIGKNSYVLELASNDGYLLSEFQKLGVRVLGVEPARNVAAVASRAGIPTIAKFFGVGVALEILKEYGRPQLIVANNVFAHIPDMQDFAEGIGLLAGETTIVTIENPSFALLLKNTLFDTIYHEHYSYLSAHSVQMAAARHGLRLFRVEQLSTHGGSNRYWLSRSMEVEGSVFDTLAFERATGLFDEASWLSFASRVAQSIEGLRQWLLERNRCGDVVVGYGAAHKGNTFLNSVGEASKVLRYVVDASPEKQGKFLPGSQVPVLSPAELNQADPTDVLILPWNIAQELAAIIRAAVPRARIWVAHPEMRLV